VVTTPPTGCCWSFDATTKRYPAGEYGVRRALQAGGMPRSSRHASIFFSVRLVAASAIR